MRLALIIIFLPIWTYAQVNISNVAMTLNDKGILAISYEIKGNMPNDSVFFTVGQYQKGLLLPKTVNANGALGRNISQGKQVFYWNMVADSVFIDDDLLVKISVIHIIPPLVVEIGGGPTNALISMLAPGIGNIFVQPKHKIGFRPAIFVAFVGLGIGAYLAKKKSNEQYDYYSQNKIVADRESFYNNANMNNHIYYAASRTAAAIWVFDIVTTLLKGLKNEKQKKNNVSWSITNRENTPMVGLNYKF